MKDFFVSLCYKSTRIGSLPLLVAQHQINEMDPYKHLQITANYDATSLTRHNIIPISSTNTNPDHPTISKDIPLTTDGTFLRIYLPTSLIRTQTRLPVVLYFHSGGFIFCSAATSFIDSAVSNRAATLPAVFVSVEYRLAPEHRLPAAYEDAEQALLWLDHSANSDAWMKKHADLSKVFIMGSSAGANIAYRLGLRSTEMKLDEVKVWGVILNQPFISGVERTESEERSVEDKRLPLASSDLMWELSLPVGASRDHEYCNPMRVVDGRAKLLPKIMVKGFKGDMLYDRQKMFVEMLKKEGVEVEVLMEDEGCHAAELIDSVKEDQLIKECRKFIYGDDDV